MLLHAWLTMTAVMFIYSFLEWTFLLSMASFMSVMPWMQRIALWLSVNVIFLAPLTGLLFLFAFLSLIFIKNKPYLSIILTNIPTALIVSAFCLIWLDNTTYSAFHWSVFSLTSPWRIVYAFGFIAFLVFALRLLVRTPSSPRHFSSFISLFPIVLIAVSILATACIMLNPENASHPLAASDWSSVGKKPNILLISVDGLNADHMSAYGYARDTTPFIKQLASASLVSTQNYTNCGRTMGSITAVLTSKSPFTTHVLFAPDILTGDDAYEHLPGILKATGYDTVQVGISFYLDAETANFHNAFQVVNGATIPDDSLLITHLRSSGLDSTLYLARLIANRLTDRLAHIFLVRIVDNPYVKLQENDATFAYDTLKVVEVIKALGNARQNGRPLFAMVHLLSAHGSTFQPSQPVYSKGKIQSEAWNVDFYDDSIRDIDRLIESLYRQIEQSGELDKTIIVINSDHGQQWTVENRLPLIVHFPGGENAGIISYNTQNIDISPTLLDYMGLEIPTWMEGQSLLKELDPARQIIAANNSTFVYANGKYVIQQSSLKPPFYQFSTLHTIQCNQMVSLSLTTGIMTQQSLSGNASTCKPNRIEDLLRMNLRFLGDAKFDIPQDWMPEQ
jgi:membrane-anchored protein YejM (alkaline phosphatase superfamily)